MTDTMLLQNEDVKAELTPADQRSQTPGQRVEPNHEDGQSRPSLGAPTDGLQGLGDHHITVDGDGQQVDHGGDAKQGAAESVHLTRYETKHTLSWSSSGMAACVLVRVESVTRLSKHPFLVKTVNEEDRRLRGCHE